jgi:cytochrome c oxidase assembly protein subunit 19
MTLTGECKTVMKQYLNCIKKVKGMNDPECRNLAKGYLACRMDRYSSLGSNNWQHWRADVTDWFLNRNLMAKDEFKNLGFPDEDPKEAAGSKGT